MVSPRFERLPKQKRERILEIAAKGFAERGYDGASVSHVLEQAGISKGAAYYYFENKADLFATVVEHHIDKVLEEQRPFLEAITREFSWSKMRQMIENTSGPAADTHRIVHLLQQAWEMSREAHDNERLAAQFCRIDEWIRILVAKGRESGAIRADLPEELLVQMVIGFHEAANRWWVSCREALDPAEEAALGLKLVDLLQGLLQPPEKAGKAEE
ncbi:MAG: hypothetical protein AMS14_05075 [Planctomycetes bacterium DG_20]|nr:MAG: hypothetical protein AMS14_05075 [Planctomycetes bacterium DG_20]